MTHEQLSSRILIIGRPNSGKTSVFNRLTGSQLKTGNYHGVTVEHAEGALTLPHVAVPTRLIDLPGTPSLIPNSPDEGLTADALLNHSLGAYDAVLVVVDALRLVEGLYMALQVLELGRPTLIAVNQLDLARDSGIELNLERLATDLNLNALRVVGISAHTGEGFENLRDELSELVAMDAQNSFDASHAEQRSLPWGRLEISALSTSTPALIQAIQDRPYPEAYLRWAILAAQEGEAPLDPQTRLLLLSALQEPAGAQAQAEAEELIHARFRWLDQHLNHWVERTEQTTYDSISRTERLDRWALHPLWGSLTFLGIMLLLFQALFVGADPLIGFIEGVMESLSLYAVAHLPDHLVSEFIIEGLIGGVGNVIVFLPQVLILFGLISLMEGSGYMARAAALMDRVMRAAGLSGRAFVPMLSGFVCAVPAVLATRTLPQRRDRLLTMMTLPLLTCSARLPVYTLLIVTLLPAEQSWFGIDQRVWVMMGLYLFSIVTVFGAVSLLGRTILKGETPPLLLHLPVYRRPVLRDVLRDLTTRSWVFIKEAGTVILAGTIVLWILLSFPRLPEPQPSLSAETAVVQTQEERLAQARAQSYGGQLGRLMEPALKPLGWDWQVGVGLIGAFAAREVFISTLGMVYGVGGDVDEEDTSLRTRIKNARHEDGSPVFTPISALALLIFFSLACQCLSTLAAVKRETGGYRWPLFMFSYMSILAYGCALLVTWLGHFLS